MKSEEAKKLSKENQEKINKKNLKNSEKNLRKIYSEIKSRAKKGYSYLSWDYREIYDVDYVLDKLSKDGYSYTIGYPYLRIRWE